MKNLFSTFTKSNKYNKFIYFNLILLQLIISINFILINNLEYKKNKNIKMSEKSINSRLKELEDLEELKILEKSEKNANLFLVYFTQPNKHW